MKSAPTLATSLWYQSADEVLAETRKPATTVGFSFWGDVYYSQDKTGDDNDTVVLAGVPFDVDNELKTKRHGLQLGAEAVRHGRQRRTVRHSDPS